MLQHPCSRAPIQHVVVIVAVVVVVSWRCGASSGKVRLVEFRLSENKEFTSVCYNSSSFGVADLRVALLSRLGTARQLTGGSIADGGVSSGYAPEKQESIGLERSGLAEETPVSS